MLTNVTHFSVNLKGVHKIWHKSMNCKWRNRILKEYHFLDNGTNSSSRVPDILTLLTRHCCEEDKVSLKFCVKKGLWSEIVYQSVYKQKLVSVVCDEVAENDWSNGTVDHKLICTSLSCQTVTEKISRMFTQFRSHGFQVINFYLCSANELPEWSRNCCVIKFVFSVMYFKC